VRFGTEVVSIDLCNCESAVPRMIEFRIRIVVLGDVKQCSLVESY
jgi:hypothetical protein